MNRAVVVLELSYEHLQRATSDMLNLWSVGQEAYLDFLDYAMLSWILS